MSSRSGRQRAVEHGHHEEAPTILDIAAAAGVSKSVVSRALLGGTGVAPATVARVLRQAEELGYVANAHARGMSARRTHTLGVLVRDAATPFYGQLLTAMQARAAELGYRVITATGAGSFDVVEEERALTTLISLRVEGLVVCSGLLPVEDVLPFARRTPTVVAGRPERHPAVSSVYCDEEQGGAGLADHIAGLGHRSVAVLTVARTGSLTQSVRSEAMVSHLRGRGVHVLRIATGDHGDDPRHADSALSAALSPGDVTAVMTPSDRWAFGVLEALRRCGRAAPDDVSVTGYDGLWPFTSDLIGLTTWRQPVERIGADAIDVVVEQLDGRRRPPTHVALDGALIAGRSAAAPRT